MTSWISALNFARTRTIGPYRVNNVPSCFYLAEPLGKSVFVRASSPTNSRVAKDLANVTHLRDFTPNLSPHTYYHLTTQGLLLGRFRLRPCPPTLPYKILPLATP